MDGVTFILTLFLTAEVVLSLIAAAYIVTVYRPVRGQAPFFDRLAVRDVASALSGALIGAVAIYSLVRFIDPGLGLEPLVPPIGALAVAIPLFVLLYGPISDAIAIWRERRNR